MSVAYSGLAGVTVRRIGLPAETGEWDRLMARYHYLGFRRLFGGGLRHVATDATGRWLALIGWGPASLRLKARDAWIGWVPEQQFRRLDLVACNSRFLILPGKHDRNLASRVLSLSTRRLSADFEHASGHPVLLAETFVDPRYAGTCYRAANWIALGQTKGFTRARHGWVMHGVRRRIFVRPLVRNARRLLRSPDELIGAKPSSAGVAPSPPQLRLLHEIVRRGIPEHRSVRGARHSRATLLTIVVSARVAGANSAREIEAFGANFSHDQLAAVRAFRSPSGASLVPPSRSTIHRLLQKTNQDAIDRWARHWIAKRTFASGGGFKALEATQPPRDPRRD